MCSSIEFVCASLFGKSGREAAEDLLAAAQLSNDYLSFVSQVQDLGTTVLVPQVLNLPAMSSGPLELPNGQPVNANALQAYEQVERTPIVLFWLEDLEGMTGIPSKLGLGALIYICISPVMEGGSDGLYRVRLMVASEDADVRMQFGPLIDDCVVRREELGKLVHDTIKSFTYQHCFSNPYFLQLLTRCRMLSRAEGIRELKAKAVRVLSELMQPVS